MPSETPKPLWLAYTGLVLTPLFWAGNAVVAKSVVGEIPPLSMSFWRWVIALTILLPFGLPGVWRQRRVIREHSLSILALANIYFFFHADPLVWLARSAAEAVMGGS